MSGRTRVATIAGALACLLAVVAWRIGHKSATLTSTSKATPRSLGHGAKALAPAAISGTITDELHAPASNVRVCAVGWDNETPRAATRDPRCTRTNAAGGYAIVGLVPSHYFVSAMGKPYLPGVYHRADEDDRFQLGAGERREHVDIALKHGGNEITGVVSDVTGGPVPHAQIHVEASGAGVASTETDDTGAFSLWVGPGELLVVADADGYASGYEPGFAPGVFKIELTPGASIAGTVVDAATNEPVAGARVDASTRESINLDAPPGDVTDDEGRFTIDRLAPNRYSILVHQPRRIGSSEGSIAAGIGQQVSGIVVRTFPAVRIEGRVVVVGSTSPCKEPSLGLMRFGQELHSGTDANGTVYADGALPGTYDVRAVCSGFVSREHYEPIVVRDVDIKGLTWEVVPGATIRGRVVSRSGAPIGGVDVFGYGVGSTESRADGRYELDGVVEGEHKLMIRSNSWTAPVNGWVVKVSPRADVDQDLVLEESGSIRGTVVDADGQPIAGASVSVDPPTAWDIGDWENSHASGAITRADGTFELLSLPTATYKVRARLDDDDVTQQTSVTAPRASAVKFVMKRSTEVIRGTVVDSSSSPITDAYVTATPEVSGRPPYFDDQNAVVTRLDGSFTIPRLASGVYVVKAFRKGGGEGFAAHVASGGVAKVTIAQTGSVEGSVNVGGAPAREIYLDATDAMGRTRNEHFYGTDGHYSIRDLPAGKYRLTAHVDHRVAQVGATLAEGEHKTAVDIDFDRGVALTGRVLDLATRKPLSGVNVTANLGEDDYRYDLDDAKPARVMTDDAGRFRIEHVPAGRVRVGASADEAGYGWSGIVYEVAGTHDVDVGDLGIVKRRVDRNDSYGELGITWVEYANDTPSNQRSFEVAAIDPKGPAAATDLRVGDVVVSVDGIDALVGNRSSAWTLMTAPPGTLLRLGLARGEVVTVVLAKP